MNGQYLNQGYVKNDDTNDFTCYCQIPAQLYIIFRIFLHEPVSPCGICELAINNKPKKALLIDPDNHSAALAGILNAAGWGIDATTDLSVARERLVAHDYPVGLTSPACLHAQTWSQTEDVIGESRGVEWIALTSPEFLENDESAKLIYHNFYDYHTLPVDRQRLLVTLGRIHGMAELKESLPATELTADKYGMIGASQVMWRLYAKIRRLAQVNAPVLITGETGTGKELTARAIHRNSTRRDKPFIAVNCGALPSELIQSELFGHEKGAFTGAHARQIGLVEAAQGGTIFLDEIADLPLSRQGNLLRFLEEKEFVRVGGHEPIHADVRVIAASNADLKESVDRRTLRADLYFRINGVRIALPPLKDRHGDIELLARHYFDRFSLEKRRHLKGFRSDSLQAMNEYNWPGNVRELVNVIHHAVIFCNTHLLRPSDLGFKRTGSIQRLPSLVTIRDEAEIRAVRRAVQFANCNVTLAARSLQISRVTLYRLMRKHGIDPANP